MDAKELRIGNNVLYNRIFSTVKNINNSTVRLIVHNELDDVLVNIEDIFPIEITPDLLFDYGWKFDPLKEIYKRSGFDNEDLRYDNMGGWIMFNFRLDNLTVENDIYYFHKLQNICYALNDEELVNIYL